MGRTDRQGYGWKLVVAVLAVSLVAPGWFGGVLFAQEKHRHDEGLAELMRHNLENFESMVGIAYFEAARRQLETEDFRRIEEEANQIADHGRQAAASYSRGEKFDKIAGDLVSHAEKVGKAAGEEDLPEVNVQIGEVAEYCAKCHNAFRW
jgi:cytochrome c556